MPYVCAICMKTFDMDGRWRGMGRGKIACHVCYLESYPPKPVDRLFSPPMQTLVEAVEAVVSPRIIKKIIKEMDRRTRELYEDDLARERRYAKEEAEKAEACAD